MNLLDATANSVNTIFAQLISKAGVQNVVAMAHKLGITEPSGRRSPYFKPVCAITLGSVGFTPLEMADVYATFACGGIHHDPQAFETVHGPNGKLISADHDAGHARPERERRRRAHLRPRRASCSTAPAPRPRSASAGGRQDRHCRELPGRLVLRLRAPACDLRLGRLSEGRDPARSTSRGYTRSRAARCRPRSGATSWSRPSPSCRSRTSRRPTSRRHGSSTATARTPTRRTRPRLD